MNKARNLSQHKTYKQETRQDKTQTQKLEIKIIRPNDSFLSTDREQVSE